jgi:predicted trehalose synthase
MADLRGWFAELARAEGAVTLPAVPLGSLEQFIDLDGRITLDPLLVQSGEGPHLAVMDIATLLREVTHVAHGALRRLVSGGDDVPAERVPTWVGAVRETLLERYEATLAAYGNDALFDRRLLRAFEIEAECRALIYASRELPTWSSVPDAGLLELLSPW